MIKVNVFNDVTRHLEPEEIDESRIVGIELPEIRMYRIDGYEQCFKLVLTDGYRYVSSSHLFETRKTLNALRATKAGA